MSFVNENVFIKYPLPGGGEATNTLYSVGKSGPKAYLQSGMHGAELQGHATIFLLIEFFKKNKLTWGRLDLLPYANPIGSISRLGQGTYGRFDPLMGENWNRQYHDLCSSSSWDLSLNEFVQLTKKLPDHDKSEKFKAFLAEQIGGESSALKDYGVSRSQELARKLQTQASSADLVLDLHTGPTAMDYLYTWSERVEEAKTLNFPLLISIPSVFGGALDEACFIPWARLEEAYEREGISFKATHSSYTLELGSEEVVSRKRSERFRDQILHFLALKGLKWEGPTVSLESSTSPVVVELKQFKTYFAKETGLFDYLKSPGESFKKGDILGEYIDLSSKVKAITNGVVVNHSVSSNVLRGQELFQVAEQ